MFRSTVAHRAEIFATALARKVLLALLATQVCAVFIPQAFAGNSGLNLIVVANRSSSNSCALASYYCERRLIPRDHILPIYWSGGNISWSGSDFTNLLLTPLLQLLGDRGLTNQINGLVLSMDIPFQTINDVTNFNSTTAALFYGLKSGLSVDSTNSYFASETDFSQTKSAVGSASFLCTMLTAKSLADAKSLVDQGVISDQTHPSQPVILVKSSDPARNIRHLLHDNALFNSRILGSPQLLRSNSDSSAGQSNLFGYATGLATYTAPANFVPGAIADSLTSFGGIIFGANDQTNLLAFIHAGATGSYGTVAEPMADLQKFPDPQVYFYQARGFSLAESYYQSIATPHLGLVVAEPLAAPFGRAGHGSWSGNVSNLTISGTASLGVNFSAADTWRPLQQIDLFVDGQFFSTLTNLSPGTDTTLSLKLNGYPFSYTVPPTATIGSIASNLTALINTPSATNATMIKAFARGDRIELQSFATNHSSFPFFATNTFDSASTTTTYRVTYLPESFPSRLIAQSPALDDNFRLKMEIPTPLKHTIEASTDLVTWQPIFTNFLSGSIDFSDLDSTNFSRRFYRVAAPPANQPPKISLLGITATNIALRLESLERQPCAIVVSSNQTIWSSLITNLPGGVSDFTLDRTPDTAQQFYRAWLIPPSLPGLQLTNPTPSSSLLRIDGATQPYRLELTTNGVNWSSLITNFGYHEIQVTTGSSTTNGQLPTAFLSASRPSFLATTAFGYQQYTFLAGTLTAGAWAQFTFNKTNGQMIVLGVTNQTAGVNATNLALEIYTAINNHPALQTNDGIIGEDFSVLGGQAKFTLRARSSGFSAAKIGIQTKRSSFSTGVSISPASYRHLTQNLSDLQPRNHLYVTAGASQLGANFTLNTTQIPDGYHELTAVAYEGSHVRTQTHTTLSLCISNSPLSATLTLLDLTNNAPVNATYHIQVSANTNNVNRVTLFSTGGPIGSATNAPVTFDVIGTNLWAGLHPFYALVETTSGQKYRTKTSWVRLQ